jgi:hypothetical protein
MTSEQTYNLFPFRLDEVFIVESLKERMRTLLQRPGTSPVDLRQIGAVLFALERLPRSTPGIAVGVGLVYRNNKESCFSDFYISESEFRLSSGGNTYDPAVGSDSYSTTAFELETSGFREGNSESDETVGWFNQFDELLGLEAAIEIEYNGDDEQVNWSDEGNVSFWNELEEDE